jgi:hypothetical protein
VHSFQGSEAPVVIHDLVVDEPHRRAGLFCPEWKDDQAKQLNVGMTRAKHRLFVVGDLKFRASNGKKAFIGELLRELAGAPVVDAEQVVPLGLSARAAAAAGPGFGAGSRPSSGGGWPARPLRPAVRARRRSARRSPGPCPAA